MVEVELLEKQAAAELLAGEPVAVAAAEKQLQVPLTFETKAAQSVESLYVPRPDYSLVKQADEKVGVPAVEEAEETIQKASWGSPLAENFDYHP